MSFLIGKNIRLVKFTQDFITEEYLGWLNNPEVNQYLYTGRFLVSKGDISIYSGEKNFLFAIIAKEINSFGDINSESDFEKYIGTISLHNIDWIVRKGEVGYLIGDRKYWGKGVATEIVGLIKEYGFNRINLNKLYAGVVSGNVGSDKALLKNGFKKYATIPQDYYLNGKYLDVSAYYNLQCWNKGGA